MGQTAPQLEKVSGAAQIGTDTTNIKNHIKIMQN